MKTLAFILGMVIPVFAQVEEHSVLNPEEYAREIRRIYAESIRGELPRPVVEALLPAPCPTPLPKKAKKQVVKQTPAPTKKAIMFPDDLLVIYGTVVFLALVVAFLLGKMMRSERVVYVHYPPRQ